MRRSGYHGSTYGRVRRRVAQLGFHCLVWSLVAVVLVPLLWPLMMSLNAVTVELLLDRGFRWWLGGVELGVLLYTLIDPGLQTLLHNSVLVASVTAAISTALAAFAAYGLQRFEFTGRGSVMLFLLALPMVPQVAYLIPFFVTFHDLGLHDTYTGVVLAHVAFTVPFTTWLLYALFSRISPRYENAALVDGCTRPGAFVRVFLPRAKSALVASFALAWILSYNELLFAVVLLDDPEKFTIPVGLRQGFFDPGTISVLVSFPAVAFLAMLWWLFADDVTAG